VESGYHKGREKRNDALLQILQYFVQSESTCLENKILHPTFTQLHRIVSKSSHRQSFSTLNLAKCNSAKIGQRREYRHEFLMIRTVLHDIL